MKVNVVCGCQPYFDVWIFNQIFDEFKEAAESANIPCQINLKSADIETDEQEGSERINGFVVTIDYDNELQLLRNIADLAISFEGYQVSNYNEYVGFWIKDIA